MVSKDLQSLNNFLEEKGLTPVINEYVPEEAWTNLLNNTGPLQKITDDGVIHFSTRNDFPEQALKYPPADTNEPHFYEFEDLADPNFGNFLTIGFSSHGGFAIYLKVGLVLISLYVSTYDWDDWRPVANRMIRTISAFIEANNEVGSRVEEQNNFVYFQADFKRDSYVFGVFQLGQDQLSWKSEKIVRSNSSTLGALFVPLQEALWEAHTDFGYDLPIVLSDFIADYEGIEPLPLSYKQRKDDFKFSSKFFDALNFANDRHAGHFRKGTEIPYLTHLLAVSSLAIEDASSDDELQDDIETIAIAALLHDVIEDTDTDIAEVEDEFGESVAAIVAACSDTHDSANKPPWKERKQIYIEHLTKVNQATLCVSLADKQHNTMRMLSDLRKEGPDFWKRFNAPPLDQKWYYETISEIFSTHRPGKASDDLKKTVKDLCKLIVQEELD